MDKIRYRSDSEMVDSGVEWIGRIPRDWIVGGFTKYINPIIDYRGKTPEKVDEGIFLVTAKNIKQGKVDYTLSTEYIRRDKYKEVMSRGIPKIGDVLFTTEAPLGQVANVDKIEIALAQRIIKFDGLDIKLNNYFLKYLIMSDGFQQNLITYATGSTALGIKASKLSQLKIILADIQEQQKIANFLDIKTTQFDKIIAKKEQLIEKLEEAKKSLISEVVTGKVKIVDGKLVPRDEREMVNSGVEWLGMIPKEWEIKKIKHISQCYPSNVDKKIKPNELKVKLCNYVDVYYNDYITNDLDFMIASANKAQIKKFQLKIGDIILTKDSESPDDIGIASYVSENIDSLVCGYHLTLIKVFKNINSLFLYYYLLSIGIKNYFETVANGVTRYGISISGFLNAKVCIPSLEEQNDIAQLIQHQMKRNKNIVEKTKTQIQKLKQAKQSLISEAVTGKIDLRDWEIIEKGE